MFPFISIPSFKLFKKFTLRIGVNCYFREATQAGRLSHKKAWASTVFPLPTAPFMFSNGLCVPALPTRQSSFPDRKSLQGLSPHHRWPFNTSLATANEPGVAAARLDPADFAQMFISRSPAVLGWEVHFNLGSIFTLFIYYYLFVTGSKHFKFSFCSLPFISSYLAEQTAFSMVSKTPV